MSTNFFVEFDMMSDNMHVFIHVSTPIGESLVLDRMYRFCLVLLVGYDTWIDLMVLGNVDFDIILGTN